MTGSFPVSKVWAILGVVSVLGSILGMGYTVRLMLQTITEVQA